MEIFRVESVIPRDGRDGGAAIRQCAAFLQHRGKVRPEWNAAVSVDHVLLGHRRVIPRITQLPIDVDVAGVKLMNARHEFVGPVALGRVLRKTDALRQQHDVLGHLLPGIEKFADQCR